MEQPASRNPNRSNRQCRDILSRCRNPQGLPPNVSTRPYAASARISPLMPAGSNGMAWPPEPLSSTPPTGGGRSVSCRRTCGPTPGFVRSKGQRELCPSRQGWTGPKHSIRWRLDSTRSGVCPTAMVRPGLDDCRHGSGKGSIHRSFVRKFPHGPGCYSTDRRPKRTADQGEPPCPASIRIFSAPSATRRL